MKKIKKSVNSPDKFREEKEFKHGELKKIVLAAIGVSLIVGTTLVFPCFPVVLSSIIGFIEESKQGKISKKKIRRVLRSLEKKEIIFLERKKNEVFVHVKDEGNVSILKYSLKKLLDLKKEKKWNGKWFLVFFDVPEEQRNKRNYLRNFLKEIGFYRYQQSVYLFPYECEEEVMLLKKIVEGAKYMSYVIAEKIEQTDRAKTYFNLN